jgi:hypothetical protein
LLPLKCLPDEKFEDWESIFKALVDIHKVIAIACYGAGGTKDVTFFLQSQGVRTSNNSLALNPLKDFPGILEHLRKKRGEGQVYEAITSVKIRLGVKEGPRLDCETWPSDKIPHFISIRYFELESLHRKNF